MNNNSDESLYMNRTYNIVMQKLLASSLEVHFALFSNQSIFWFNIETMLIN